MSRQADTDGLYDLLEHLAAVTGGPRLLRDATASSGWPTQGVYFFFEPGEHRLNGRPRVVRIGTHALRPHTKATLWERLAQHRGHVRGSNPGGGDHRGSIFRLHVGAALIARGDVEGLPLAAWLADRPSVQYTEAERACERIVSAHIREMPVVCLPVPTQGSGKSDRGMIEAGCIALLSGAANGVDPASDGWLGRHAVNPAVSGSGLWNVRHVTDAYAPAALRLLESYVLRAS